MAFIDPILSINPPTRGSALSVKLTKLSLQGDSAFIAEADAYFADSTNWKYVLIVMQSSEGKQTEVMIFDCDNLDNEVYTDFLISDTSRDVWEVQTLVVTDFDGGYMRLSSREGQLNPNDFNFDLGALPPLDPPIENHTLSIEVLSDTSIKFNWINGIGTNTGSRVTYAEGTTAINCLTGPSVDVGTASSHTFIGLTPGTTYTFTVCAYNANDDHANGASIGGTTDISPNVNILTWSGDRKSSNIILSQDSVLNDTATLGLSSNLYEWVYHGGTLSLAAGGKYYYEISVSGGLSQVGAIGLDIVDNVSDLFLLKGNNNIAFRDDIDVFGFDDTRSDTSYQISSQNSRITRNSLGQDDGKAANSWTADAGIVNIAIDLDAIEPVIYFGKNNVYAYQNIGLGTGGLRLRATKDLICLCFALTANGSATINQTPVWPVPSGYTYLTD